jgi:RNA polymerase sigma factor (sigma-70 family)
MRSDLGALVERARNGDRESLAHVVEQIQGPIYNLALRMLWHPEDARDATQDILIRVITHLGSFRGDSRVQTWVYRVAANYLITVRQSRVEEQNYTFDRFADELRDGLGSKTTPSIGSRTNSATVSPKWGPKMNRRPTRRYYSRRLKWVACMASSRASIVRIVSRTFWARYWRWTESRRRAF